MAYTKPLKEVENRYVLGSTPRLKLTTIDTNGITFVPTEARLDVKSPDGTIYTYSGGNMTSASGFLYVIFNPVLTGWYQYEGWVKDGNNLQDADTRGFEVYDLVHND